MKAEGASKVNPRRVGTRVGATKLTAPVTLFAQIEAEQHEALRSIAFAERRSLAEVVRQALAEYLTKHPRRLAGRALVAAKR